MFTHMLHETCSWSLAHLVCLHMHIFLSCCHFLSIQSTDCVQAMLARYTPLGSASCPLFGRKFREDDALTVLGVAEGYLQTPDLQPKPAA